MRKPSLLACLLGVFLAASVFLACNKLADDSTATESSVPQLMMLAVQKYYQEEVSNSPDKKGSSRIKPQWTKSRVITATSGEILVAVPTLDYRFKHDKLTIFRELVFSFRKAKVVSGEIVEFIVDKNESTEEKRVLITKIKDRHISGFTGAILRYNLHYRSLEGRAYKAGVIDGVRSKILQISKNKTEATSAASSVNANTSSSNSGGDSGGGCLAGTNYYFVTTYSDGTETWDYLYTICHVYANSGGDTSGDSGGHGGGPNGENPQQDPAQTCNAEIANLLGGVSSPNTLVSSSDEEIDAEKIRRNYEWIALEGRVGWKVASFDHAIKKRTTSSTNPWKFDNLIHDAISLRGTVAGGTVECSELSNEPTVGLYNSIMALRIKMTATCTVFGVPYSSHRDFSPQKTFHIND